MVCWIKVISVHRYLLLCGVPMSRIKAVCTTLLRHVMEYFILKFSFTEYQNNAKGHLFVGCDKENYKGASLCGTSVNTKGQGYRPHRGTSPSPEGPH